MNTTFTLKNFRVFDNDKGGTFRLSPITILTGCNSSGKSSVVKAVLLLRDFFKGIYSQPVHDCRLDFGNQTAKLGRYDLALHKAPGKRNNNDKLYFSYTVNPYHEAEKLLVELWFEPRKNDTLRNGWLNRVVIRKASSRNVVMDISYTQQNDDASVIIFNINRINLNVIKKDFLRFVFLDILKDQEYLLSETGDKNVREDVIALLNMLSRYMPADDLNKAIENMKGYPPEYFSDYAQSLYSIADEQNSIFCLPILSKLKGVKKQDTRTTILSIIADADNKSKFVYNNILNRVLDEFEKSSYNDFVSYYKAKEREALLFQNIKRRVQVRKGDSTCSWLFGVKGPRFTDCIDSYSTIIGLYNLLNGVNMMYDISDNYNGDSNEQYAPYQFGVIYSLMLAVSKFIDEEHAQQFIKQLCGLEDGNHFGVYNEHAIFADLCKYLDDIVSNALAPAQFRNFYYVGDSAVEIKRVYALDNKDEMGILLAKYIEECRIGQDTMPEESWAELVKFAAPGEFLSKWVKAFGIGEKVVIELSDDGYGVLIRLFKDSNDQTGRLLADEGFGITKFIVTLINIEYAILTAPRNAAITLSIEEPENHLHPKFQSLLADLFVDAYKTYNIQFIIETHSEYLIRRLQSFVAKKELTTDEVSLQYVYDASPEKRPKGEPHVKNISINADGTLKDSFGPGFLDEADSLAMDLLTIKAQQ